MTQFKRKLSISAIMPAYNEEQALEAAVLKNLASFAEAGLDFDIIIVNDCSTDATRSIGERLAREHPLVSCHSLPVNGGSGAALRRGIELSDKEFVIFAPVDNPLTVEDLSAYLLRVDVCDIVVGNRMERVGYTRFARFSSFVYNRILIPLLFNIGVNDVNWIQIYRREHFRNGTLQYQSNRLFYLVEILVKAKKAGLIVAEVPAKMNRRVYGNPTCSKPSVMLLTLWELFRFFTKQQMKSEQ
jgi:glycosyltransferase involved in cell wall biosynthesis